MRGSGGRFRAETGEHDHIGETNETKRPGRGRVSDQHGGHKGETRRATEGRVVFFAGFGFVREGGTPSAQVRKRLTVDGMACYQ